MIVRECMTKDVVLADPGMSLQKAAEKMKDGDFGILPVGENDRLVGMITDRDIAIRGVANDRNTATTSVREIMSSKVLYCYDEQDVEEVSQNMGMNQVRRLPVLNREKRLVGIVTLGDLAKPELNSTYIGAALSNISGRDHHAPPFLNI